ncbi:MAG: hypothetical protein EBZ69_03895, partial [Alphaproteobacteria bacterium]|nr:hypothetical protein [Alphaproteobacteria bacterium]
MLSAGKTYVFQSGDTQTIVDLFYANPGCNNPIWIRSSNQGDRAVLRSTSQPVVVANMRIRDMAAVGGAAFTANSSVDYGNNAGWTINQVAPRNLYWVGGTGNWSDPSHWSTSPGGAGGSCIPSLRDNVFFTSGSFPLTFQSVNIDQPAYCKSMSWTGVLNNPTLQGSEELHLYGSLTFVQNMTSNFTGRVYFESNSSGNSIAMAAKALQNDVIFDGAGGVWSLQDAFLQTYGTLSLKNGTLNSNNYSITLVRFHSYGFGQNARVLNLGASTLTITGSGPNTWYIDDAGPLQISAAQANFVLSSYPVFFGGNGYAFGNVSFTANAPDIQNAVYSNNSSFQDIRFTGFGQVGGQFNWRDLTAGGDLRFSVNNGTGRLVQASLNLDYWAYGCQINQVQAGGDIRGNINADSYGNYLSGAPSDNVIGKLS